MSKAIAHISVALLAALVPIGFAMVPGKALQMVDPPPPMNPAAPLPSATPPQQQREESVPPPTLNPRLVQAAVDRAVANPEDYEAQLELRRMIYAFESGERCTEMIDMLHAIDADDRERFATAYRDVFARWAELEPERACKNGIQFHKAGGFEGQALAGAFHTYAAADLDAALDWLENNANSFFDWHQLLDGAFAQVIAYQNNGAEMYARVMAMEDAELRDPLASSVLRSWARDLPPMDVMRAMEALPEGSFREQRIAEVVAAIGIERPSSAFHFLDKIADPERRAQVAHEVFWPYALTRTPDIHRSPPDPVQALENHVGHWPHVVFSDAGNALTRHRARAALEKANKIVAGPERDAFVAGMVDGAIYTDDPASVRSALELVSEARRDELAARLTAQLEPAPAP